MSNTTTTLNYCTVNTEAESNQNRRALRTSLKRLLNDAYSRAVRRITAHFDRVPDTLTTADLKLFFASLIQTHSWSTIKLDRNGLPFFYRYTLNKQWEWLNIVKLPQVN